MASSSSVCHYGESHIGAVVRQKRSRCSFTVGESSIHVTPYLCAWRFASSPPTNTIVLQQWR